MCDAKILAACRVARLLHHLDFIECILIRVDLIESVVSNQNFDSLISPLLNLILRFDFILNWYRLTHRLNQPLFQTLVESAVSEFIECMHLNHRVTWLNQLFRIEISIHRSDLLDLNLVLYYFFDLI